MQNNAGIVKKNQDLSLKQSSVFLLLPKNKTVKYAQIKVKKYAQNSKLLRIVRSTK